MRTRTRFAICFVVLASIAAVGAPAGAKTTRMKVVGTDEAGDWSASTNPGLAPVGEALGQDLVKASIGMRGRDTVVFNIHVTALPSPAGPSAPAGYAWDFTVDGRSYELLTCTPSTIASCSDPSTGSVMFALYECTFAAVGGGCLQVGPPVTAELDAASGAVAVPVALDAVRAAKGSVIAGSAPFGAAVYSFTGEVARLGVITLPSDDLMVTRSFSVP